MGTPHPDRPDLATEAEEWARDAGDALGELFERVLPTFRLPRLPDLPEVLDPHGMRHRVRHGVEWVQDQLEPLRDKMDPVADRIDALRRRPLAPDSPPPGTEPEDDDGWGIIEWALFLLVLELLSGLELTLDIDVDRALWSFGDDDEARFVVWNKVVFTPAASFAARLGDPLMHGDVVAPGAGSSNVFIGGKPALRTCDVHVCTKATPVPHASAGFRSTYGGVEINEFPALRVGDYVDEGPHGLNPIVAGCPTVTVGPVAPPVECYSPGAAEPLRRPGTYPFRWRKGEMGHFKGKVVLGVGFEGPFARVEGRVTAARLWAEETTTVDIPLGDIDGDGKNEAERITTRTKTERVLGVSDVEIEVRYPLRRPKVEVEPVRRDDLTPSKPEVKHTKKIVEVP
ncbi:MAG: hypothetical protein AB1Z98_20955 [Nannocystaceae bacterium]